MKVHELFLFAIDTIKGEYPESQWPDYHGETDADEVKANARLIAAAPDMLEALKCVRLWAEGVQENYTGTHPIAKVRDAIVRATGDNQ